MRLALRGSELVKWQFRGVAQTGLMVPRNYPGHQRARKQMHWSTETIFRVLEAHEPDHPLLEEAYRQATQIFLDAEEANAFLDRVQHFDWQLRELPVVSPFSFPIYASKIKETMMLEDPAVAVERIYREMYARVRQVATANENRTNCHDPIDEVQGPLLRSRGRVREVSPALSGRTVRTSRLNFAATRTGVGLCHRQRPGRRGVGPSISRR